MNPKVGLTATEVSNIWAAYMKNSMDLRFFEYFTSTTNDEDIKKVIDQMINHCNSNLNELKSMFTQENLTIPIGFTDEDVRIGGHPLFADTLMLYFCNDTTFLTLATYPSAFSDSSRNDIRTHLQKSIEFSLQIQNQCVDLMKLRGSYLSPPQLAINHDIDLVESLHYFNGLFGGSRPVNTNEIANLTRIIHRAQFSKMIFVSFGKMTSDQKLKHHFSKGRDEIEKALHSLREVLEKENIPVSASADYKINDIELSPFSDKLMLFFINTCLGVFCFSMVNQALTSSLRSDILYKLTQISDDMKKYYAKGLLFAVKEKWFEQPPQAMNRKLE